MATLDTDIAEIKHQVNQLLTKRYCLILNGKVSAAQWCLDRALYDSVHQEDAAAFLKDRYGLAVSLLPEPEIFLTITKSIRRI